MLIAALIFVMVITSLLQFAMWSWRAGLLRVAGLEPGFQSLAQSNPVAQILLESQDFPEVMGYQKLCPQLGGEAGLRAVALYYRFLKLASDLGHAIFPVGHKGWAIREMGLCTRYAAVVMIQRLERNQDLAAQARAY